MDIGTILYATTRDEWRAWLADNFASASEIWLANPKKASGKQGVPYNDAVEEALCFGWVDSIIKRLDDDYSVQRYTPRRKRSNWSQPNKERLAWLLEHDRMHPSLVEEARAVIAEPFVFPADIVAAIRADPTAWAFYQSCSPGYQRIRVAYIHDARKRSDEFDKRLASFIRACNQGKLLGYGGIEKYY